MGCRMRLPCFRSRCHLTIEGTQGLLMEQCLLATVLHQHEALRSRVLKAAAAAAWSGGSKMWL